MGRHDWMVLEPGEEIDGYRVESFVARGGMAVVYKAIDRRLGRPVGLKVIAPELAEDSTFRARFARESELAASLDHPNILPIYQAGEVDGMLYIVMRFVEGEDIDAVLKRRGRLTAPEALTIFGAVAGALDAAHARQLVHRDVKPGNTLLTGHDDAQGGMNLESRHVYLTDFGLTKRSASRTGLTTAGQFLGTIAYVAPEQIANQMVDHRADIYALGCVLHHVLAGEPPFARDDYVAMMWAHISEEPPPLSSLVPGLPPDGDAVLARAMAKNPAARPQSCRELIDQLRAAYSGAAARSEAGAPLVPALPGSDAATIRVRRTDPAEIRPRAALPAPPPAPMTPAPMTPAPRPGSGPRVEPTPGPGPASVDALAESPTVPGARLTARPALPAVPSSAPPAPGPPVSGPPSPGPAADRNTLVHHRRPSTAAMLPAGAPPKPGGPPRAPIGVDPGPDVDRPRRWSVLVSSLVAFVVLVVAGAVGIRLLGSDHDGQASRPPAATNTPAAAGSSTSASPSATVSQAPVSVASPTVRKTIPVGAGPQGVVFSPNGGKFAYVANSDAKTISVIDTARQAVVATITLSHQPQYLAIRPDGKRLYASTHDANGGGNGVAVINTATNKPATWIMVGQILKSDPYALAVSPDGSRIYVPDHTQDTVAVIDTRTNLAINSLPVLKAPHWVTFDPVKHIALVANHESSVLTVIDTDTTEVLQTIGVGKSPHSVAVTPDGARAFTANYDGDSASIVDLNLRRNLRTLAIGSHPRCVAISADGRHAYYAMNAEGVLRVLDTATLKVTASVRVGSGPWVVAVAPDGRTAYVTNRDANTVSALTV